MPLALIRSCSDSSATVTPASSQRSATPASVSRAATIPIRVAVEIERHAQFYQRLDLALPRKDALARGRDILQVAGADGGQADAARALQIDDPPSGEIALQGPRRLFFDLRPCRVGDRGELAVQVVHRRGPPLSEPMPSELSGIGRMGCEGSSAGGSLAGCTVAGTPDVTSSRKVAVGTKKRLPVTARLKSKIRS